MHIESVKLSPKRGGNGYNSSYSVSIGAKEAKACGLAGKRIIKILDETNCAISFKPKQFTVQQEVVNEVIRLKKNEAKENDRISEKYAEKHDWSYTEMVQLYIDEASGKVARPEKEKLKKFLLSVPIEMLCDLVLLMYIGRDYNVDMSVKPGEERFLKYFDTYNYIVLGRDKHELANKLMEKTPLIKYLKTGFKLIYAPEGTDIYEILYE